MAPPSPRSCTRTLPCSAAALAAAGAAETINLPPPDMDSGKTVMQDDKLLDLETAAAAAAPAPAPKAEAPKAPEAPKAAPAPKAADVPAGGYKVTSPLPGSIIKVLVSEGQDVKKGDTLASIAVENYTTVSILCKLNKFKKTTKLWKGRKIRVK